MVTKELKELSASALCELNNAHALETSFLAEDRLSWMIERAFYARGFPGPAAFLIAFDETAPYVNVNFRFFGQRHGRFVYIDRMITASHARRQGLGRQLYEELFERARAAGHHVVGCEVNLDPPNVVSDAFHARLNFEEVGRATLENGKTVRYLERAL